MGKISIRIPLLAILPVAVLIAAPIVYFSTPRSTQVRVSFEVLVPSYSGIDAKIEPSEILFEPGEPFTSTLTVRNLSRREVWAKVAHNVEPQIMAKLMGMLDCGSFLPFHLGPGEESEATSTYLIWTNVPPGLKSFTVSYQFELDQGVEKNTGVLE
jgi:cytochrome c oxidase assembly protein Cox11